MLQTQLVLQTQYFTQYVSEKKQKLGTIKWWDVLLSEFKQREAKPRDAITCIYDNVLTYTQRIQII